MKLNFELTFGHTSISEGMTLATVLSLRMIRCPWFHASFCRPEHHIMTVSSGGNILLYGIPSMGLTTDDTIRSRAPR